MSDTPEKGQAEGSAPQTDPLNNIKQEFGRKLGNVESQIAALAETNKQLLAQMTAKQAPTSEPTNLEDLWYKDPNAAAAAIVDQTTKQIEARLNQTQKIQQKQTQVLSKLTQEFPELNDENSALTRKAVEIYNTLDEDDKRSPTAYRLAVKEAATELGVKPMNKRTDEELDAYSMSSGGNNYARGNAKARKGDEISPATLKLAELMGQPVHDAKYLERLKATAKRTNWTKYE